MSTRDLTLKTFNSVDRKTSNSLQITCASLTRYATNKVTMRVYSQAIAIMDQNQWKLVKSPKYKYPSLSRQRINNWRLITFLLHRQQMEHLARLSSTSLCWNSTIETTRSLLLMSKPELCRRHSTHQLSPTWSWWTLPSKTRHLSLTKLTLSRDLVALPGVEDLANLGQISATWGLQMALSAQNSEI